MASTTDSTPGSAATGSMGGSGDGAGGNAAGPGCGCLHCPDKALSEQGMLEALIRWLKGEWPPAASAERSELEKCIEKPWNQYKSHLEEQRKSGMEVRVNQDSEPPDWSSPTGLCCCPHCKDKSPSEEQIIGASIRIAAEDWSDLTGRFIDSYTKQLLKNILAQAKESWPQPNNSGNGGRDE